MEDQGKQLRPHHKAVIDRYVTHRCHAGAGFQSIIEGRPTWARLDEYVRRDIAKIMDYVHDTVPEQARGSRANYKRWCGEAEEV